MDINLKGAFVCSRAAALRMRAGSAIVNVASLAGRASSPVDGLRLLSLQGRAARPDAPPGQGAGARGIRVTAVNPGVVMTSLVTDHQSPEFLNRVIETIRSVGRPSQKRLRR